MFDKISNYITDMIYETLPNVDPQKREIIEYGVYMSVSEIVKLGIIIIIGSLLCILKYVFGVIAIYGFQRMVMGGVHAKTHTGCVIAHSTLVFSIVALANVMHINRLFLLMFIVPFAYLSAYKYAPADLPQKPIKSKKQRKQLRVLGFILLTSLFVTSYYVPQIWANIILLTCLVQAASMTPLVYKLTKNKYGREEAAT